MPKTITLKQLKRAGACREQVVLFKSTFGESVTVTVRRARSVADHFDWDWAASSLLSDSALKTYYEATAPALKTYDEAIAPAWKTYGEVIAPAWKTYEEAIAPALKTYDEARAAALKTYDEATAPALKTYDEATAPALKTYEEARATVFARAYLSDN